jgi:hypothetical protein
MKNDRLLMPVDTEFLDSLNVLFGAGMFGEVKQRLVPLALEIIRMSLLGHTHPFETLRGLTDLQWEDLLENPYTPSLVNRLLDELEAHPELENLLRTLRQPEVVQRLRAEWLYEMTVGRFEHTVPYLYKEEELLKDWETFCQTCRDSSPFNFAEQEAQRAAAIRGAGLSESAKRLFKLSFMAACRKLFVFFSGARETWIGCCTMENFQMGPALSGLLASKDSAQNNDRLSLRFGLVDHVYYLKPTLEQINRYAECVKELDFIFSIQQKLCPFVTLTGDGVNLMAEVFYRVYQPQRLRELHSAPPAAEDNAFLERTGLSQALFAQMRFIPMSDGTLRFLTAKIDSLPRLRPFLRNPRTEAGLLRQRLYRAILDPILTAVTQETLLSLCRQWNPMTRTPEGSTLSLMAYVEAKASRVARCDQTDPGAEVSRRRAILEELLQILTQNTQSWQKNMEQDSFVVDRSRSYFITVLDKAMDESGEMRHTRVRDSRRVACVVVE